MVGFVENQPSCETAAAGAVLWLTAKRSSWSLVENLRARILVSPTINCDRQCERDRPDVAVNTHSVDTACCEIRRCAVMRAGLSYARDWSFAALRAALVLSCCHPCASCCGQARAERRAACSHTATSKHARDAAPHPPERALCAVSFPLSPAQWPPEAGTWDDGVWTPKPLCFQSYESLQPPLQPLSSYFRGSGHAFPRFRPSQPTLT